MNKKTRICIVCGKKYEYCNSCRQHSTLPSWMTIYHDENCRNIMNIGTDYMAGILTKADAKAMLDKCDLSDRKNFKESVAKAVDEILNSKKTEKFEKESKPVSE